MSSHDEKPIITKYTKRFQNPNGNLNVPLDDENEDAEFLSQLMDDNNSSVVTGSMTTSSVTGNNNRLNLDVPKDSILNEYPYMKIQRETLAPSQLSFNSKANTSESSVIYSITSTERDLNKKALNSKENRPIFDHSSPISNASKNEVDIREPNKTLKTDFNSTKAKSSPVNHSNAPTVSTTPTLIPPTRSSTPTKQHNNTQTTTIASENPILKNALNRRPVKLGVLPQSNKKLNEQSSTDMETSTMSILPSYKSNSNNSSFLKRKVRIQSPKTSERLSSRPTTPSSTSSTTIITMPKIQKPLQAVPSSIARPIIVENIRINQPIQAQTLQQQPPAQPILANKFYRPLYSNVLNPPVIYQEMPVLVETVQPLYMTTAPSYNDMSGSSTATLINGSTNNSNLLKSRIQLEKYPLSYAEQKIQQSTPSPYIYKARQLQSTTSPYMNKPLNGGTLAPTMMRNSYDEPSSLSGQKNADYPNSMQPKPLKSILKNSTTRNNNNNNTENLYAQNKNNVRINV